jgi:hypothetical protein
VDNKTVAGLIAKGLREGLTTPGKPNAAKILLPQFRTVGMPKEMSELADETATLLGEAIAGLIETEGGFEMIAKEDIAQLREEARRVMQDDSSRRVIPIYCRCDKTRSQPLAIITVTDSPSIVIDGKQMVENLSKLSPECPHERIVR